MTLFDAPDATNEHDVDASMWFSEPYTVKTQPSGDDDQKNDVKSPVDVVADLDLRNAFVTTDAPTVKMEIDSDFTGTADSVDMFDESVFEFKMMQLESAASPVPSASASSSSPDQASAITRNMTELERRKLLSLERRRKRNREAMQRSRQRDKDYMDGLRDQAAELERHHNNLVEQMNQRLSLASDDSHVAELKAQLEEARQKAQTLMEQNLKFQEDITDRMKSEDRMEGLLKELLKDQERTAGTLIAILHEHMAPRLTTERAMEIIMKALKKRERIQKKRFPTVDHEYKFFGWEIHHYFHGKHLYLKFGKMFRNRTAEEISERAWNNSWQSISYRSTMDPRKVTQCINDDTFISAIDRYNPENPHEGVRVYNLRFRVREPDGVVCIGTQTLPESFYDSTLENVWGSDVCLATVFTPVQECDMATGELLEHCRIQFIGKTRFGPHQLAQQNALETVLSLARWEESNVGTTQRLLWNSETPEIVDES